MDGQQQYTDSIGSVVSFVLPVISSIQYVEGWHVGCRPEDAGAMPKRKQQKNDISTSLARVFVTAMLYIYYLLFTVISYICNLTVPTVRKNESERSLRAGSTVNGTGCCTRTVTVRVAASLGDGTKEPTGVPPTNNS
jgi:hypothetical protein